LVAFCGWANPSPRVASAANPDRPAFYLDLPVAYPSGELIQKVWDRCLSFDPVFNCLERLDNLRKLSGILLDAGSHDDYNLHWGHRLLSHRLHEAGIVHEARENPGSHGGHHTSDARMSPCRRGAVMPGSAPPE
jgi:hypothetical protein